MTEYEDEVAAASSVAVDASEAPQDPRSLLAFDEGKATAKQGIGTNRNPYFADNEPGQHRAWLDGHISHAKC